MIHTFKQVDSIAKVNPRQATDITTRSAVRRRTCESVSFSGPFCNKSFREPWLCVLRQGRASRKSLVCRVWGGHS